MGKISFSDFILLTFIFGVGGGMAGLFGLLADVALSATGLSEAGILFLSNFVTGLVLCAFYWQKRVRQVDWQHVLDDRLDKVGLMNHYVRNALQVLITYASETNSMEGKAAVEQAGKRIEWALSDVLPCGWEIDEHLPKPLQRHEGPSTTVQPAAVALAESRVS